MLRYALLLLLALPLAADPTLRGDAVIRPAPAGQPFHVREIEGQKNVKVYNDTQLHMSARIVGVGTDTGELQPHVQSLDPRSLDPKLIGPQGGLFSGYTANEVSFNQPQGRNARVEIVTAGTGGGESMSSSEWNLHKRLWQRSIVDQFILPMITAMSGHSFSNRLKYQLLQNALSEILAQNHVIYEELKAASDAKDRGAWASAMWNFVYRDIEAGGPIYNAIWNIAKVNIKRKIAEYTARRIATKWIPFVNAVDLILQIWNWGPTGASVMNYIHDVMRTPTKKTFQVYFHPGALAISPTTVRTDRDDKVFTILGHRLNDRTVRPQVHFYDRNGSVFLSRRPFEVATDGESMKVRVTARSLAALHGHITCRVAFGSRINRLPEQIRLINVIRITRLEPARGRPGQRVRVYGDDLYPFRFANKVYFGSRRARNIVAGPNHLEVEVPNLPEDPEDIKVWVEEEYSGRKKESNKLDFKRLPGTHEEAERNRIAAEMPENETLIEGTLTDADPEFVRPIAVSAGMQIEAKLESLLGVRGFSLREWGLTIRTHNFRNETVRRWVAREENVAQSQPNSVLQHTSNGSSGAHTYYLQLKRARGDDVRFRVRVKTIKRDDCGKGVDAGETRETAMELPVGGPWDAHLFGDPKIAHEDRHDWYRISAAPENERVTVTIHGIKKRSRADARIARVKLYRVRGGRLEEASVSPRNLGEFDLPVRLHQDDTEERDLYVHVEHGTGLPNYRISLSIEHIAGGALELTPIVSRFNEGTDEGWMVTGNFSDRPRRPSYRRTPLGEGYIASADYSSSNGPLDIVFVIDTTGSMRDAINSVKNSAREIITELRRRSTSLRVGLVPFKDHAADGANARSVRGLSDDVSGRLAEVGGWSVGGGGGDGPEDVLYGLQGAVDMTWRDTDSRGVEVAKAIILITDNPAKVNGQGKDFGNRSIVSVADAAKRKGIAIYPLPLASSGTLRSQSNTLATRTGGDVLSAERPGQAAQAILAIAEHAVDRSSPRYFTAPVKFLGDVSRFYNRTIQFDLRGQPQERRINTPDLLLVGRSKTLYMQTFVHPDWRPLDRGRGFQSFAVRMTERYRWYVEATGARATRQDFDDVLKELKEFKIRGEFYSGEDECALDNVRFGGNASVTDRGLTDLGIRWTAVLQNRIRIMERLHQAYYDAYRSPIDRVRNKFADEGVRDPTTYSYGAATTLATAVTRGGDNSLINRLYTDEIDRLRRNIEFIRRRGGLTEANTTMFTEDVAKWRTRQTRSKELVEALTNQLVIKAKAESTRFSVGSTEFQRLTRQMRAAETEITRIEGLLNNLKTPPSFRLMTR